MAYSSTTPYLLALLRFRVGLSAFAFWGTRAYLAPVTRRTWLPDMVICRPDRRRGLSRAESVLDGRRESSGPSIRRGCQRPNAGKASGCIHAPSGDSVPDEQQSASRCRRSRDIEGFLAAEGAYRKWTARGPTSIAGQSLVRSRGAASRRFVPHVGRSGGR